MRWYAEGDSQYPPLQPDYPDLGGWVYERAFIHFCSTAPKEVPPDKLHTYYDKHVGNLIETLQLIMAPSQEDQWAFYDAMEIFTEYEKYGFPEAGGFYDQDSTYMAVLDCVRTARDAADYWKNHHEAHMSFQKEQEAEEKAQETAV